LSAASALFAVALAARSVDLATCPLMRIGGLVLSTHALWHLANAGVVHLLLQAAIRAAQEAWPLDTASRRQA
jgi:hypothetical protein